jgi:hypothetical protein fuD12_04086
MSIKSIEIKNFKTIKDSKIEFKRNLSAIYGPNGTGKTAIIEVLDIMKLYFVNPFMKCETLEKKILKGISIGEKNLIIDVIFSIDEFDYKILVEFNKYTDDSLYVSREELSFKETNSKRKFKNIVKIVNNENLLSPEIYIENSTKNNFDILEKSILSQIEGGAKRFINDFANLSSYLSLIIKYANIKDNEKVSIPEKLSLVMTHFSKIEKIFLDMVIITLEEQALYNLNLLIPMNIHTNKAHGTLAVNYRDSIGNIYTEKEAEILEETVKEINSIFSTIIPNSKLSTERKITSLEGEELKVGVNIYVEREGRKLLLDQESTGVIKLVSLLSIILYYIKDKNAIVAIDEFDIHIFEYLLALFLEKVALYAKGQLIFTAHNLLPMEKLDKESIIISTKDEKKGVSYVYLKGASVTTNLRQKYLRSQTMWTEENIEPLLLNSSALEMFIKKLVI